MPAMGWAMLYLFVFLKLPIVAACLLIWWAIRQTPDYDESDGGGPYRRPHPAAEAAARPAARPAPRAGAAAPPRVRSVRARARETLP